jgi:uncharacterized protein with FMN-binding domain
MSFKILASTAVFLGAGGVVTVSAPYLLTTNGSLGNSAVVAEMARSQMTTGDYLAAAGAFRSAAEAYETAARLIRAQGKLPVEEVRRIANAQYYDGNYVAAASTLEGLAYEAAYHGDYLAYFWATVDAARMAHLAGDNSLARRLESRVRLLLQSDELSEETRADLAQKLDETDLTVFAPHLGNW